MTSREDTGPEAGHHRSVARITATKFKDAVCPLRFSYIGNVYRYNEYGGGKQNEFTQAGVEILGVNTPESDAEVISIAVQALKISGLEGFRVDIGQVDFLNGLMEETVFPRTIFPRSGR